MCRPEISGNYLGLLAEAKVAVCQHCGEIENVSIYGINKYLMIIQSIQRIVDYVRNDIVVNQYSQVQDPKSLKTYYECVTYTYQGTLDSNNDKGQNVDTQA